MVDFDLEWVRDNDALDRFVAEIYDAADAEFRAEVSQDDFRDQFRQDQVVLARRDGNIVAWVQVGEDRKDDTYPGRWALPSAKDGEEAALRHLLSAAVANFGGDGIAWIATTGTIKERTAREIGATVHRELFRIWQAPHHRWPSLDALPRASTVQVRSPLSDTLLSDYAQFYTAAGVTQCDETGCTTIWDEAMIAEDMAQRDASVHTEALYGENGLLAEAYAFTSRDEMCVMLTCKEAPNTGLSTLVTSLLHRVHANDPTIRAAMIQLPAEDLDTIGPALTDAGFEETGTRVIYHLRPGAEA